MSLTLRRHLIIFSIALSLNSEEQLRLVRRVLRMYHLLTLTVFRDVLNEGDPLHIVVSIYQIASLFPSIFIPEHSLPAVTLCVTQVLFIPGLRVQIARRPGRQLHTHTGFYPR